MTAESKGVLADRKLMKVAASVGWDLRKPDVRANSVELGRAVETAVLEVFTDTALGAMAKGALGVSAPPHGHWLTPFWQAGRSAHAYAVADFLNTTGQYVTNDASRESALQSARCDALEQAAKIVESVGNVSRYEIAAAIRKLMQPIPAPVPVTHSQVAKAAEEFLASQLGPLTMEFTLESADLSKFFPRKPKGAK